MFRGSLLGGRNVLDFDVDVGPTTGFCVVLTMQWIVEEEVEERGYHSGWTGLVSWLISQAPGILGTRLPRSKLPVAAAILPLA